jgi:uncharacterized membrane protein YphA (DoxX/SURF4 family)
MVKRLLFLILVVSPSLASAHVRWFVGNEHAAPDYRWIAQDYILLVVAAVGCLLVAALHRIQTNVERFSFFRPWSGERQFRLLSIAVGLWLLSGYYHGEFIAPNIHLDTSIQVALKLQLIAGLMLLISHRWASRTLVLPVLIAYLMVTFPPELWIDYVPELMGFAVAIALSRQPQRAVKYLRILLGVQLIILAVHNKLLNPNLGLAFLEMHPWNFLPYVGLPMFSDVNFVVGIGVAELALGLLIVAGLATRLIAALITTVFLTTGILLGIEELMGHIPIVVGFLILVSLGAGEYGFPELSRAQLRRGLVKCRNLVQRWAGLPIQRF